MHDCRKIEERLVDLVFGELGEEQSASLLAELASCQHCRAEYQSFKATLATFDKAADLMLPDENYWHDYDRRLQTRLAANEPVNFWQRWVEFAQGTLLRPAWAISISALLLLALLSWFLVKQPAPVPNDQAKQGETPPIAERSGEDNPGPANNDPNKFAGKGITDGETSGPQNRSIKPVKNSPSPKPRVDQLAKARPGKQPEVERPVSESEFPPVVSGSENDYLVRTLASDETLRHFEKAQNLLRSFRNLNPNSATSESEIADEKNRSRSLLLRNVLLRREAETRGNLPVEEVLSDLEPLLIDIAHLPRKAPSREVRAIRERIQRKEMIGKLQLYSVRPVIAETRVE
jgi:hypothetical protein